MTNDVGRYLIDLIIHLDDVTQKWVEFLITIEAGLALAFGFFLTSGDGTDSHQRLILYLIPILGALAALTLTWIAILAQQWQGWYVSRFNKLQLTDDLVFPSYRGADAKLPNKQPWDAYSWIILVFGLLISGGWVAVLIEVL